MRPCPPAWWRHGAAWWRRAGPLLRDDAMTLFTIAYQEATDGELSLADLNQASAVSAAMGVRMVMFDPAQSPASIVAELEAIGGVDVIVNLFDGVLEVARRLAPRLRLVQGTLSGYDEYHHGGQVIMDGLRELGVSYSNNGGANAAAVAEHTVMLMLMACRDAPAYYASARAGTWRAGVPQPRKGTRELAGQTVGIVGFGNVGRLVARRLAGFRCRLLYHDVIELPIGRQGELDAEAVSLDELLREADIVSMHVPHLPSTRGMMSTPQFAAMKESAIYISTCRGPGKCS